ncbi:MAG: hypothetical protein A3I07_00985 [Candidatus Doudnabacteria bacterium RIFCSPLOWO2_02_FULL_42_9]|uniref:Uncharacterized protein n=1 Tax=Candidatus Doudnabacteria bacterium RIFCSPHIGHO2_01_FULL_41_86 TaxID=1817821 RepID=A0A1F5N8B9_9BACT|nr:MAG: hypothetical protein A2717_04725 [Candidatus Doudnabacteria bacterium RIFCSPHIGHO2_01_FULL_41_86]OGE75914.1 MAG: hypothetical protein A3K07_04315 [Candidatus Doudnabacteria bacterium RIFCSPHIGHO2_01_43_10]OGE86289.1 MAG: hypothetical protein A3E28_04080 [Candidatus Doudnabacteria bacterium RIFCSPHIGHO2_12_FULL_42_22]OGE87137.1 MAG: hypothetical protein A3C49_03745 [Candidatus Doudnabacteria bacterium RIFCSPHIGHO2_02_FULL_42_25]OGE92277.1 MAG: hypothetical protein A2895_04430 [Candidatus
MHLKHDNYMMVTTVLFLVIGVAHLYRAFNNIPVTFGDTNISVGVSWVVGVLALYLAYSGHKTKH